MTPPVVAFFNNKGGVGKTSLVYHLAWMYAELGLRVVAADLDPQANLTAAFLDETELLSVWPESGPRPTVYGAISPLLRGVGDIAPAPPIAVSDRVGLLPGDLALSLFEDELSAQWPECLDGKERGFRVISAFWRLLEDAARRRRADLVLVDVGPNLGAINRAALVAADHVVVPLAPDLFSVQGLRNLGPRLRQWRKEWSDRVKRNPDPEELRLPAGDMRPAGYILLQHGVRLGQPVTAYRRWMDRIPTVYRSDVLAEDPGGAPEVGDDPYCLAQLKHYRSLMPMAQEAHKPVFALRPADGAFGGHQQAVQRAYGDFDALARRIAAEVLPVAKQKRLGK
jgi:chromosome partitioning protein